MIASDQRRRWRCTCAYEGTFFNGWQKQPNRQSVQDKIEETLASIFRHPVSTVGAGRTDAGVHAAGQVFHFDAEWRHSSQALLQSLRSSFPDGISPRKVDPATPGFHAHLSARGKRYRYRLCKGWSMPEKDRFVHSMRNRPLRIDWMKDASQHFIGVHDFSAFAANRGNGDQESPVKKVWRVDWIERAEELQLVVEGSGFLYKMVRSMAGAMIDVGLGKISPAEIACILRSRQRTARVVSAPAKGLWMEKVFYRLPRLALHLTE